MPMDADTTVRNRRNCSPYSADELARFRKLLTEQQEGLQRSSDGLSSAALRESDAGGGDATVPDEAAEAASDRNEQEMSLNFLGRTQTELEEVAAALERIDHRSYGLCFDCGQPIPSARLEAIPSATTCIACKSKSESEG
jgi:RNA polymerase-binding protein DksA